MSIIDQDTLHNLREIIRNLDNCGRQQLFIELFKLNYNKIL